MSFRLKDRASYYQASQYYDTIGTKLDGDKQVDVCIIGAGFTGISAALQCAKQGYNTVVIESQHVGYGASGRNGGQAIIGFHHDYGDIKAQYGQECADTTWQIAQNSMHYLEGLIAEYNIECDFKKNYATLATKQRHIKMLQQQQCEYEALGYEHLYTIDHHNIRQFIDSPRYKYALVDTQSGHLHPLNYILGMAHAAAKEGAIIYDNSLVTHIDEQHNIVHANNYTIKAQKIIIAGGAYLNYNNIVQPSLYERLMPAGTYILATEPLGAMADSLLSHDQACCDSNFVLDYFRLSADKRLLFGGRCSYTTWEPDNIMSWMRPRLRYVFPQLSDVAIDYAWGGVLGLTRNRMPDCGFITPDILYTQGFSGHGVLLSSYYGYLMSQSLQQSHHAFNMMQSIPHKSFPGGIVRMPLLAAAMIFYRLRDIIS